MNSCSTESNSSTKALLSLYIDGKNVEIEDMAESLKRLSEIENPKEVVDEIYLISIYCFLSSKVEKQRLVEAIEQVEKHSLLQDMEPIEIALINSKLSLSKALLGNSISFSSELESIVAIENLAKLDDLATISLLTLMIGVFSDSCEYIEFGCKLAELIVSFTKENGEVDVLFLHEKGSYRKDKCRVSVFIMMTLYAKLTDDDEVVAYLSKLDPYTLGLFQSTSVEKRLLCRLLEKASPLACALPKRSRVIKETPGLMKIQSEGFSYVTSTKKKVGIGSISYQNNVIIPSFAPHVLPLGKSDLYGLNDPICVNGETKDGVLKMWNRVKSLDPYGDHHVHSSIACSENSAKMESFLWSGNKEEELSMVLFLRGSAITMDGKKYKSGGLERAFAKTAKIDVHLSESILQLHMKEQTSVELIPLAGGEFFWNSDFILAFPYIPGRVLSLELVMD